MRRNLALLVFTVLTIFVAAQDHTAPARAVGLCFSATCLSPGGGNANPSPPFPAISFPPTSSPYPYPSGQSWTQPVPSPIATPVASALYSTAGYVGHVQGNACIADAAIQQYSTAAAAEAVAPTLSPLSSEELCTAFISGSIAHFVFSPQAMQAQGQSVSRLIVNGVTYTGLPNNSIVQYRVPRATGVTYTGIAQNSGNTEFYAIYLTPSTVAHALSVAPQPFRPVTGYIGAFARPEEQAPFGMFAFNSVQVAPSPYPTPNPSNLFGSSGYCDAVATNGYSITTGYPMDFNKWNDMVKEGVQWTRTGFNTFNDDLRFVNGYGYVRFGDFDAVQCQNARNGIQTHIEIPSNGAQYSSGSHNEYENPTAYAGLCTAIAQHEDATFPTNRIFEIDGNELNIAGNWSTTGMDNPTAWAWPQGPAIYAKACYQAIKAVDPTYIVYWGEISTATLQSGGTAYTSDQYLTAAYKTAGCNIGTCFDAFTAHITPCNESLAQFDVTDNGIAYNDCVDINWLPHTVQLLQSLGETRPIHWGITETGDIAFNPSTSQNAGNHADQAYILADYMRAFEENPNIDFVDIANNIDEDGDDAYVFDNQALMDASGPMPSPYPAYGVIQNFAGIANSVPSLAFGTVPTSQFLVSKSLLSGYTQDIDAQLSTVTGTAPVTAVTDVSGQNHPAAQATNGPTLVASAINGHSAFSYNGTSNVLSTSLLQATPTTVTVAGMIEPTAETAAQDIVDCGSGNYGCVALGLDATGHPYFFSPAYSSLLCSAATAPIAVNTPTYLVAQFSYAPGANASNAAFYANGTLIGSSTCTLGSTTPWPNTTHDLVIGGGINYFHGYIGSLQVFNSILTAGFRQELEGTEEWEWGNQAALPTSHPYATQSPAPAPTTPAWSQEMTDSFARSNSTPGPAMNTTAVGNNWTDEYGGVWYLNSDVLERTSNATPAPYDWDTVLARPVTESPTINQRIVVTIPAIQTSVGQDQKWDVALRYQGPGQPYYMAEFSVAGIPMVYGVLAGGNDQQMLAGSHSFYPIEQVQQTVCLPIVGDTFSMDASVTNENPSIVTLIVTDTTTGNVCATFKGYDETLVPQTPNISGVGITGNVQGAYQVGYSSATSYAAPGPSPSPTPPPGPSIIQSKIASNATSITFTSAPTNGDRVICAYGNSGLGSTVVDSNSVALTQRGTIANGADGDEVTIADYVVSGSPTSTYTFATSQGRVACYEVANAGVTPTVYTTSVASGTQAVATATVGQGDLLIGVGTDTTTAAVETGTFSQGTSVEDIAAVTKLWIGHMVQTPSAGTTTLTLTASGTSAGYQGLFADYPL
jgi:hypothetical protein